jgi:hypothetical protein
MPSMPARQKLKQQQPMEKLSGNYWIGISVRMHADYSSN